MLKKILIADDEPNIRRLAQLIIDPDEYCLITAENGQDAYEKAIQHSPDLIFSDVIMPKCDGFELCKRLKENTTIKASSFILLTDSTDQEFHHRSSIVHADDCLKKPFSGEELLNKIQFWTAPTSQIKIPDIVESFDYFTLGVHAIDRQLSLMIPSQSFLIFRGKIGHGQSWLSQQFILEGLNQSQHCLLLSFEPFLKDHRSPIIINDNQQPFFHFFNAANWTNIQSRSWRNLDFIYDQLCDICEYSNIQRIVIDSICHGIPFWSTQSIVSFIDLCRSLPNNKNQCIVWTFNTHSSIQELEYHLCNMMDISISLTKNSDDGILSTIDFSKSQSYNSSPVTIQPN